MSDIRSSQLSLALMENQRLMDEMRMLKNQSSSSMKDFQTFAKASDNTKIVAESRSTDKINSNENGDSKNTEPEITQMH